MVGDRDRESDEDEVRRHVEQREAEPLPEPRLPWSSKRVAVSGFSPMPMHHETGDQKGGDHRDGRHDDRVGPFGQVDGSAHV